jgi:hypothetical protein
MNAVHAAGPSPVIRVTRPRLVSALVRRELGKGLALLVVLAALSAAGAAYEVYAADGGDAPLTGRLLRRFDLTLLGVLVLFLVFRTAAAIEMDHANGWLASFFAAGGSRMSYGIVSAATSLFTPFMLFFVAAVVFALSVAGFSGSAELVVRLPRTIGGGLLVLGSFAVLTVALGIAIRRASAVAFLVGILVIGPLFLVLQYATSEAEPPLWAFRLQLISPLIVPPPDVANIVRGIVYIAAVGFIAALVSHRYAGRVS